MDDNLQREVFEELKSSKGFEELVKQSPRFRVRTREAIPELFFDFSPETKPEDAMELKHLLDNSQMLSHYGRTIDPKNLSGEKVKGIFEKARQSLRAINQQRYDEAVSNLDDYQVIKRYDKLYSELRKK